MKNIIVIAALLTFSGAGSQAQAQAVNNSAEGLAIARQTCSECHAIQKGQTRSPNSSSPTFVEIANVPGMTTMALMAALTTPHAGMPMFILTADQRESIIAYILSLKQ
jgi:mono/diheme cytochrome c family protein